VIKDEDLRALLDLYLYSEIEDKKALDIFLIENKIDFNKFSKAVEEQIINKKEELEREEKY
jgi:hypothetical protein